MIEKTWWILNDKQMLQSRLNQFFPTKSCVITLWIELYDPKQFDRVQRAENQSLRFQNSFFNRYFWCVPVTRKSIVHGQQQKYLLLENCHRNINPASWSTKDGVNIWAPSFTICLRISWWPPSMAARRTSWVILENFVPPYLLVSQPTPPGLFPMVSTF